MGQTKRKLITRIIEYKSNLRKGLLILLSEHALHHKIDNTEVLEEER